MANVAEPTYPTIDLDQFEHGMKIKIMVLLLLLLLLLYFVKDLPTYCIGWFSSMLLAKPTLTHNYQKKSLFIDNHIDCLNQKIDTMWVPPN